MKPTMSILLAGAMVLGGLFLGRTFHHTPAVHAQNGCDASSFSGAYGYNLTGVTYDAQGFQYILAAVGRGVADGAGGITGGDTFSFDGTIVRRTFTGTYTVNADCTGSVTLQVSITGTNNTGATHGDIVAVNNGREVDFVQTDAPFVFSGAFKKQVQ
jgi:hypothetical protein